MDKIQSSIEISGTKFNFNIPLIEKDFKIWLQKKTIELVKYREKIQTLSKKDFMYQRIKDNIRLLEFLTKNAEDLREQHLQQERHEIERRKRERERKAREQHEREEWERREQELRKQEQERKKLEKKKQNYQMKVQRAKNEPSLETLKPLKVDDLRKIAREKGVNHPNKMGKNDLINEIQTNLKTHTK